MSAIPLPEWRSHAKKNLREVAEAIGLSGRNPARTLHRYETGERACPLDVAIRIEVLTGGVVTPASFSSSRSKHLVSHSSAPLVVNKNGAGATDCPVPVAAHAAHGGAR